MNDTGIYQGMLAETISINGSGGDAIHTYIAKPLGAGPFPGVVLIHHLPGWDEWYREATRKFAHHGYLAISPDLYCRVGHGSPDEDDAARVTGESAPAGSASRRGPRRLGAGRSGGVDGSHADGAGERRQRRRMVWPNAYFAEQGLYSLVTAHALARQSARR